MSRSRLDDILDLLRPLNLILAAVVVAVAFALAGICPSQPYRALTFLAVLAIMGGGNALNDYFDREVDRIAHPHRPIPRGFPARGAALLGASLLLGGPLLTLPLGTGPFLLATAAAFLIFAYDAFLKRLPLIGNLTVALTSGATFLFVGLVVGRIRPLLFPAGFAALFHLGRELLKDIQDQEGDRKLGMRTLPILVGPRLALWAAKGVFAALILFSLLPVWTGDYGRAYLWTVLLGVDLPLLGLILFLPPHAAPTTFGKVSTFLKAEIFAALLALYLGGAA